MRGVSLVYSQVIIWRKPCLYSISRFPGIENSPNFFSILIRSTKLTKNSLFSVRIKSKTLFLSQNKTTQKRRLISQACQRTANFPSNRNILIYLHISFMAYSFSLNHIRQATNFFFMFSIASKPKSLIRIPRTSRSCLKSLRLGKH